MRMLLSCFMLFATFSLIASEESLIGDNEVAIREAVADHDADLRIILQEGFLKEEDFQSMLRSVAAYTLFEMDIKGSPYRLISAFTEEMKKPESEKRFLDVIHSCFTVEEAKEMATLLQTDSYKAYRPSLNCISYECSTIAHSILKRLASSEKEQVERPIASRNSSDPHLRIILEQVFLNDKYHQEVIDELAEDILEDEQNTTLTTQELTAKFQEAMHNRVSEEEFFELIRFYFSDDDIEKVSEFVQDPIYNRYCEEFIQLTYSCLEQSWVVYVELLRTSAEKIFASENQCFFKELREDNFDAMMASDKPVILLIDASERNYEVEEFEKLYGNTYDIYHLNVDEQGFEFATKFAGFGSFSLEITEDGFVRNHSKYTYPTCIFIDHGKEVGAHEGVILMKGLLRKANELFGVRTHP